MLLFHPAANSCEALLEKSFACCLCLIASKQLAEAVLWPLEDEACQLGLIGALVIVEASGESPPTAPGVLDTRLNAQLKQFGSWRPDPDSVGADALQLPWNSYAFPLST